MEREEGVSMRRRMSGRRVRQGSSGGYLKGGLGDRLSPKDVDTTQLRMGVKVEMEHTSNPKIAREIALDHLAEDPAYYSKLKRMESKK